MSEQQKNQSQEQEQEQVEVKVYFKDKIDENIVSYLKDNSKKHHTTKKGRETFEVDSSMIELDISNIENWIKSQDTISFNSLMAKLDFLNSDSTDLEDSFRQKYITELSSSLEKIAKDRLSNLSPKQFGRIKEYLSDDVAEELTSEYMELL